jgi:GPH family glycoside/pentoside/hexuronide:cation symporter
MLDLASLILKLFVKSKENNLKDKIENTTTFSRLTLLKKCAFGLGGMSDALMSSTFMQLWTPIYIIALGINPFLIGIAMGIPRVWDAVTDPFMGNISDNTRSKWGRRRPYMFMGSLLAGLLFVTLWTVPRHWSEVFQFAYILAIMILFFTAYTVFSVPYGALGFELSTDYNERTKVQGIRGFNAMFACIFMPWAYKLCRIFGDSNLQDSDRDLDGVIWVGLLFGAIIILTGIIPAIFTPENLSCQRQKKIRFLNAVKITLKNKPFLYIAGTILSAVTTTYIWFSFLMFMNIYYVFQGNKDKAAMMYALYGTIGSIASALGVPLVVWLGTVFGKRKVIIAGNIFVLMASLSSWFLFSPQYPYLQLLLAPVIGIGQLCVFVLLASMLADVTDLDELESGLRREGMYGAIYSWTFKTSNGITLLLLGAMLAFIGIDTGIQFQTAEAILRMRLLVAIAPAICSLAVIILIYLCPLTKQRVMEIRQLLDDKNKIDEHNKEKR